MITHGVCSLNAVHGRLTAPNNRRTLIKRHLHLHLHLRFGTYLMSLLVSSHLTSTFNEPALYAPPIHSVGPIYTTGICIAAAITDWLDRYIARKMKLETAFGAFLDPVADKLMVAATLVLLCRRPLDDSIFGDSLWLITISSICIIGREITMSAVREWAASQGSKLSQDKGPIVQF